MESMKSVLNGLKYRKEHLACENYASEEEAIWESVEAGTDKFLVKEAVKHPTLIFVLDGEINISTAGAINQRVYAGEMFLIPAGDNFYGRPVTNVWLMRCSFSRNIHMCSRFSIERLRNYVPKMVLPTGLTLLPIHEILDKELRIIRDALKEGLACLHYQQMKMEIMFIELRGFYNREDLARLFAPILGEDNDFKNKVMQLYTQVETAKELSSLLRMSPSCFKRKFLETFGTSAKQWMIQKKKEKLLRDILMTNMSIAELAEKYKFTANYLTTFSKEHLGKSPTELRAEYRDPCISSYNMV